MKAKPRYAYSIRTINQRLAFSKVMCSNMRNDHHRRASTTTTNEQQGSTDCMSVRRLHMSVNRYLGTALAIIKSFLMPSFKQPY